MLKKIYGNVCPNLKCQRTFGDPILIYNKSVVPNEIYYGCPFCFFKTEVSSKIVPKRIEEVFKIKTGENATSEPVYVSNCPQYFGYLRDHFKDSIIMYQCLVCDKMLDCIQNCKIINKVQEETCVA